MKPFRRASVFLWLLLRNLPPVPMVVLFMPAIFLSSWTVLIAFDLPQSSAFVWAIVSAQMAHVSRVLSIRFTRSEGDSKSEKPDIAFYCFGVICFSILACQLWWAEPWFSQRVFTSYGVIYAAVTIWGVLGDKAALDILTPVSEDSDVPLVYRRHLLMLYAFVAILAIAVNESLIVIDAPLGVRVATLSLLPLALHYFYEIALILTIPIDDEGQ